MKKGKREGGRESFGLRKERKIQTVRKKREERKGKGKGIERSFIGSFDLK